MIAYLNRIAWGALSPEPWSASDAGAEDGTSEETRTFISCGDIRAVLGRNGLGLALGDTGAAGGYIDY